MDHQTSTFRLQARDMEAKLGREQAAKQATKFMFESGRRDPEGRWFWFMVLACLVGVEQAEEQRAKLTVIRGGAR